jgi:ribosomal protein S12 methylthiotransferase
MTCPTRAQTSWTNVTRDSWNAPHRFQRAYAKVGRDEGAGGRVDGRAIARTAGDAPEIDGVVNVKKAQGLRAGEFATVKITAAGTYDLAAVPA